MEDNKVTPAKRIELILHSLNLNAKSFAESMGLDRPDRLYNITRGRNSISKNMAETITYHYPMISYVWLISGEGDPFIYEKDNSESTEVGKTLSSLNKTPIELAEVVGMQHLSEIINALKGAPPSQELKNKIRNLSGNRGLPLLNYSDIKGSIEESVEIYRGDYYNLPFVKLNCLLVSQYKLTSNDIRIGDVLGLRKIDGSFFLPGKPYILDTTQGLILCEVLEEGLNVQSDYGKFKIPLSEVIGIFNVATILRSL
jgi:hypothetical protein